MFHYTFTYISYRLFAVDIAPPCGQVIDSQRAVLLPTALPLLSPPVDCFLIVFLSFSCALTFIRTAQVGCYRNLVL